MSDEKCSFCNKTRKDTYLLISGNVGVFICDDCVRFCVEMVMTHRVHDLQTERSGETE